MIKHLDTSMINLRKTGDLDTEIAVIVPCYCLNIILYCDMINSNL